MAPYRSRSAQADDGYTTGQKVLLVSMILMILCVFGIAAFLLLSNGKPQTAIPASPAYAYVTLTSSPIPSLSPIQTSTPIPGWVRFTGGGAELWLPENYQGGDAKLDREAIFSSLEAAGADPANFEAKEQYFIDQDIAIYAFEDDSASVFFTEVYVFNEEVGNSSLNPVVDDFVYEFQTTYRIVPREEVFLSPYKMERVMMELKDTSVDLQYSTYGTRVLYFIKVDNLVWVVQYITDREQVKARLPTFDRSASTFTIHP